MPFRLWPRKKSPDESPVEQPDPVAVAEVPDLVSEPVIGPEWATLYNPGTKVATIPYMSEFGTEERAAETDAIKRRARLDQNANNAALTGGA